MNTSTAAGLVTSAIFVILVLSNVEKAPQPPGGATPEEVFQKAVDSYARHDWETYYGCFYPEVASGWLIMEIVYPPDLMFIDKKIRGEWAKLCARYGVATPSDVSDLKDAAFTQQMEEDWKTLARLDAHAPRKAKLFSDLMKFTKHMSNGPKGMVGWVSHGEKLLSVTYEGEGGRATFSTPNGLIVDDAVFFLRFSGRWYLVLMTA